MKSTLDNDERRSLLLTGVHRALNCYEDSAFLERLLTLLSRPDIQKIPLQFVDIDGTATGRPEVQRRVRGLQEQLAPLAYVTARVPEMELSTQAYKNSVSRGFHRKAPNCKRGADGKFKYTLMEDLEGFAGLLDPSAVLSLGEGIIVQNASEEWYHVDQVFEQYCLMEGLNVCPPFWRKVVHAFLEERMPDACEYLVPLEDEKNYYSGVTDVEPPRFRVGLRFSGAKGLRKKNELVRRIQSLSARRWALIPFEDIASFDKEVDLLKERSASEVSQVVVEERAYNLQKIANSLAIVDESRPGDGQYTLYLVPRFATKEHMVSHFIDSILEVLEKRLSTEELQAAYKRLVFFYAGDTMTDVTSLCAGRVNMPGVILVPGGSPVIPYLSPLGKNHGEGYAGLNLAKIKLRPTNVTGVYDYYPIPSNTGVVRKVILGDERFPGTTAVETLCAFLESTPCYLM